MSDALFSEQQHSNWQLKLWHTQLDSIWQLKLWHTQLSALEQPLICKRIVSFADQLGVRPRLHNLGNCLLVFQKHQQNF